MDEKLSFVAECLRGDLGMVALFVGEVLAAFSVDEQDGGYRPLGQFEENDDD